MLELVEGETLAERIASGPIPVDEALAIARQIADALEAAHEKGIVHRDLKPANVKVTPEGKVKVLDFGLAKALTGDASSPDQTHSPTLTAAATQAGVVIGTAAYMSPEQARGQGRSTSAPTSGPSARCSTRCSRAARRSTARRSRTRWPRCCAPTRTGRVSRRSTPPAVRERFCATASTASEVPARATSPTRRSLSDGSRERRSRRARRRPGSAEFPPGSCGVLRGFSPERSRRLLSSGRLSRHASPGQPVRFEVAAPPDHRVVGTVALARDGSHRRLHGTSAGRRRRALDSCARDQAARLQGTEGAHLPFWSPDGRSVGYVASGALKGIATRVAAPRSDAGLCDDDVRGACWDEADRSSSRRHYRASCRFRPREGWSSRAHALDKPERDFHPRPASRTGGFPLLRHGSTGQGPARSSSGRSGRARSSTSCSRARSRLREPGIPLIRPRPAPFGAARPTPTARAFPFTRRLSATIVAEFVDEGPAGHLRFSRGNDLLARSSELDEPAGGARSPGTRDRKARGGRDLVLPSSLSGRSAAGRRGVADTTVGTSGRSTSLGTWRRA